MKLLEIINAIDIIIKENPGCTTKTIQEQVAKRFPQPHDLPINQINFLRRRSKYIWTALHSNRYKNIGRGNRHAWFLRKVNPRNPLYLYLGQKVKVKRICEVTYVNDDRILLHHHAFLPNLKTCTIVGVGIAKKGLGKDCKSAYWETIDGGEYVQAALRIEKYVYLYVCKDGILDKEFLVDPKDIVI